MKTLTRKPDLAWGALTLASALVVVAGLIGGRVGGVAMMLAACSFPALLLGALAPGSTRPRVLRSVTWSLGLLLLSAGAGSWWLSPQRATVAGLPFSAWLMFAGLVILPLILVGLGHAAAFDDGDAEASPSVPPDLE